ncbi:hypothetical protein ACWKW6_12790 [Dyadobacter jiangsuensis]
MLFRPFQAGDPVPALVEPGRQLRSWTSQVNLASIDCDERFVLWLESYNLECGSCGRLWRGLWS